MCELCDLDVKAAPFARRYLLELTATAAAGLALAPHWPAATNVSFNLSLAMFRCIVLGFQLWITLFTSGSHLTNFGAISEHLIAFLGRPGTKMLRASMSAEWQNTGD